MKTYIHYISILLFLLLFSLKTSAQSGDNKYTSFLPGNLWLDNEGRLINAHGGGILYHNGKYYWFGEYKSEIGCSALVGVTCYSSTDLYNWKKETIALHVSNDKKSPITEGCIIERPKVIYNTETQKFVMYFHLELKNKGYTAANVGVAVSDKIEGPYKLIKNERVNAGKWPLNMNGNQRKSKIKDTDFQEWWTPEWISAIKDGLFVRRDFIGGQMSRDMTLFVDDDKKAYHIYSSEDNLTLHIAELTDDYLNYTGKYIRVAPGGHNEAPAIFKKDGRYFMITSGCTGWDPNAARLLVADNIMGDWTLYPNPCNGKDKDLTFHSQSTYILPIVGKEDAFIFMADRWIPRNPMDSRYIWLPIQFEDGLPVLKWFDEWNLNFFEQINPDNSIPKDIKGHKLIWKEEFNNKGNLDTAIWNYEYGMKRNEEYQWYQADNAICKNGVLTITAKKERVKNPNYDLNSKDWHKNREYAEYTSSSINTREKKEFKYGRFLIRARIPIADGAWPAIWTLGVNMEWPSNGEIDIMEYYRINNKPHILANAAWGTEQRYNAKWKSSAKPFSHFLKKDPYWADKFHIWQMDWDEEAILLYLDGELLNEIPLSETINGSLGNFSNPFKQPHYLLLNLAIGGLHGGIPDDTAFPLKYEVDYIRVYKKTE